MGKTLHSRESIAEQVERVRTELEQLSELVGGYDPSLPPQKISRDWIREIVKARRRRERIFPPWLFSDPGWDILLELYAVEFANEPTTITDVCKTANVKATTGLRWVGRLEEAGLITRSPDPNDARRVLLRLSKSGLSAMREYFDEPSSSAVAV